MQSHVQECCDWPATHERLEAPATQHTTVKKIEIDKRELVLAD